MPCPPSLEERRFPELDHEYSSYSIILKKLMEEYPDTKDLFKEMLKIANDEIPEEIKEPGIKIIDTTCPMWILVLPQDIT